MESFLNISMCLSTYSQDLYPALGWRQDGSFGSPSNSPFLEAVEMQSPIGLRPSSGRSSRVFGSTYVTRLPVVGMPTQNHIATVVHKPIQIQLPLCERDVKTALAARCHMDDTFAMYTLNACCSIQLPIKHSSRGPPASATDIKRSSFCTNTPTTVPDNER